jgi:hypothetical protein
VLLENGVEQLALEGGEGCRAAFAGAGKVDSQVEGNFTLIEHDDPVGQHNGLTHVMGHEKCGETLFLPDLLDEPLHGDAGERIERPQGLVEGKEIGLADQGPGQRRALLVDLFCQLHGLQSLDNPGIVAAAPGSQTHRDIVADIGPWQ